jgi:23S rRNA pseudouridine955/2504/2580 synthase
VDEIVVPPGESAKNLENFLRKSFPLGYIRKLFRKNAVRLDGRRSKPDQVVTAGQRVQLFIPFERRIGARPAAGPAPSGFIPIFEDKDLLVVNKPPGIAVHEAKDILKRHTLIGRLESRYRPRGISVRLVHRLDRDTSGLLLVAKNERTAEELESRFASGGVAKKYVCLVAGRIPQNHGTIDTSLPGRQGHSVRAVTRFAVVRRFSDTTLLQVTIETGRMHQIRLHFAHEGYPVVMDDQHGDFGFNRRFRSRYGLKRQFLHASRLSLEYRGRRRVWTAPLPADLQTTLGRLGLDRTSLSEPTAE